MSEPWPEWLSPEYGAIHNHLTNLIVSALEHCYASQDAAWPDGGPWTMDGLFSIAAGNIMSQLQRWGYPPPAVEPVERRRAEEVRRYWSGEPEEPEELVEARRRYAEWGAKRRWCAEMDGEPGGPTGNDWQGSDDDAVELLRTFASMLGLEDPL